MIVAPIANRSRPGCMRTGTSALLHDVTCTYGINSDITFNQAGRITQCKQQADQEVREYGKLGEVVSETLTLTAAANGGSTPPV